MNECLYEWKDFEIEVHFIMLDISFVSWSVRIYKILTNISLEV